MPKLFVRTRVWFGRNHSHSIRTAHWDMLPNYLDYDSRAALSPLFVCDSAELVDTGACHLRAEFKEVLERQDQKLASCIVNYAGRNAG
jgi:hypothetical protein